MVNGHGKSDSSVVPGKPPNKAEGPAAEAVEGRGLAKGNPLTRNASRTQSRTNAHSTLERVRQAAKKDRKQRFTALLHHVYDIERLRAAYLALKREAASGVDGETWRHYGQALEGNLQDLSERLKRGAYQAKPVRRAYIPKADGRQRPLGVPTLEDKIVQRAVGEILNAIYETDFLGFSYGFRPGRSPHQALELQEVKLELRRRMHLPMPEVGGYLRSVILGHVRYYGVPMNYESISAFHWRVGRLWWRVLRRRSQNNRLTWERMGRYIRRWLPPVHICHPYPLERLTAMTQGGSRMR